MSLTQTRKHRYTCGTAAQPTMDAQPELPRRESASITLAVESFGRLGEEGYEFIDKLATHAAGGRDGESMAQKGVFKERLLQVISVATQVAILSLIHI